MAKPQRCGLMPTYRISVVNKDFEAENSRELASLEIARDQALKGALEIGVAEIGEGKPYFAAEVNIHCDGERLARYVVSVGVSPLR